MKKIKMQFSKAKYPTSIDAWSAFILQDVEPSLWTIGKTKKRWWVFKLR